MSAGPQAAGAVSALAAASASLEPAEAYLDTCPLVVETCVLAGADASAPLHDCTVVAVADPRAMRPRRSSQARPRIAEYLRVMACRAPVPLRIAEVILLPGPLPRQSGQLDRAAVTERLAEWRRARTRTAPHPDVDSHDLDSHDLDSPAARRLLAVLGEITGGEAARLGAGFDQSLELDLGLDSLDLIQVRTFLERELGVMLAPEDEWTLETLGDLVRLLPPAPRSPGPETLVYDWSARLREPPVRSLDERFTLPRTGIRTAVSLVGRFILRRATRFLFRTRLIGLERLPRGNPYLLCPTHESLIDSALLWAELPWPVIDNMAVVAFGEYFRRPPASWLVKMGRLILSNQVGDTVESMRLAWTALQRGMSVGIFPEGSRTYTGDVLPARRGMGILACEAQVPVVPAIFLSGDTLSPQHPELRRCSIRMVIGEPIPPPPRPFGRAEYQRHADRWRAAVIALKAAHAALR